MKKAMFLPTILSSIVLFTACRKENTHVATASPAGSSVTASSSHSYAQRLPNTQDTASAYISISEANLMISSYLASINAATNDSDARAFTISADSLRAYLADSSITNIKLVLAHTSAYASSGSYGKPVGYQAGGLTIIVTAFNASGNYVYYNGKVLDHCAPCPYTCPSGNAADPLLQ